MLHCMECGASFRGPGRYCEHYELIDGRNRRYSYKAYEQFHYNSDSTDSIGLHMGTNQRNLLHRTRFIDEYKDLDMGDSNYSHALHHIHKIRGGDDRWSSRHEICNIDTTLHPPLVQTFNTLSRTHAIRSMTYNVSPHGDRSVTAEANPEREMCNICKTWFPDHAKLACHRLEFSAGCEEHRKCMRPEEAIYHAYKKKHYRCFVRGCYSLYRREGDWRPSIIEEHIRRTHDYRGLS
ncbi:hypothetical protein J1614_001073 [Plenodomus biglobosus]|nr:hypothetical protein J1614_001073 [Plenodomus biglobosus]